MEKPKLYIKNMVCSRCKMAVKTELEKAGLQPISIELGEVELKDTAANDQLEQLNSSLKALGFELIDDKKTKTIEKIKNAIIKMSYFTLA